ncbi:MAG: 16S rRNA (guanine(966)-N(2))-methyltransferase RsmD [Candidatus Melainabacteria bacterium]|nr:16S rRNA (guanine(966)-N(2))-methyltransferase RsmD [Candidatus Melainabacteria bacterium]
MYIIGGKLKGRKLANCKIGSIRPAMALVRKSIFDTLKDFVVNASILDLCAGSGALGIEALSRGAGDLTLVDSNKDAIKLIYKNLELCKLKAKVVFGKLPKVLNKIDVKNKSFNLIFLDPPYGRSDFIENVLKVLILNKLIAKDGLISIESEEKCNFLLPGELQLYKEKKYGNTRVTFLKQVII